MHSGGNLCSVEIENGKRLREESNLPEPDANSKSPDYTTDSFLVFLNLK